MVLTHLKNKFENIKKDQCLLQSDVIILTETWLDEEQDLNCYNLPDYKQNFDNGGRGKGIAAYFNKRFTHERDIKHDGMSVTMIKSKDLEIINFLGC